MSKMIHHGKLVSGGRVQIPADVRRELNLADGDAIKMAVVDGKLQLWSARVNWEALRAIVRKYVPEGVSLADELIADRRAEAARE